MTRETWRNTWMAVAGAMARRSRCTRAQVGAVVVGPDQRVAGTGYNGPPPSWPDGLPCPREVGYPKSSCVAVHAEANAIIHGDRSRMAGGTLYVTRLPCLECAKLAAAVGIMTVDCVLTEDDRHYEEVATFLVRCGIHLNLTF